MTKHALLIGVSQYQSELSPLPGTADDIKAMRGVLSHTEMGGFDEVQTLLNPEPMAMQEAIELFFSNCKKNDLALLFFSGHGIKDDQGRLYFSTPKTRKNDKGELIRATAVPAAFVQDVMTNSRGKRQVVILDCCFSGAFAEGMTAKESGSVDISTQLGGEGRAVLTSSSSTQYSFEQVGEVGSVYTRYVVEGIETGAADTNNDGFVSVDELHEYARKKVHAAAPAMRPKIYAVEEGFKIHVARAAVDDPYLKYRKEADKLATRGEFSVVGRFTLDTLQKELGVTPEAATQIETEVLKPYREYQQRLHDYEEALHQTLQSNQTLTESDREELQLLRQVLDLEAADVDSIEARVMSSTNQAVASNRLMASLKTVRSAPANSSEAAPLEDLISSFKRAIKPDGATSDRAGQAPITSALPAKPKSNEPRSPVPDTTAPALEDANAVVRETPQPAEAKALSTPMPLPKVQPSPSAQPSPPVQPSPRQRSEVSQPTPAVAQGKRDGTSSPASPQRSRQNPSRKMVRITQNPGARTQTKAPLPSHPQARSQARDPLSSSPVAPTPLPLYPEHQHPPEHPLGQPYPAQGHNPHQPYGSHPQATSPYAMGHPQSTNHPPAQSKVWIWVAAALGGTLLTILALVLLGLGVFLGSGFEYEGGDYSPDQEFPEGTPPPRPEDAPPPPRPGNAPPPRPGE